jgi:oligoribonuclease NrnB/cAMP/cGMP phosphodiesterase (DHH superfamily)
MKLKDNILKKFTTDNIKNKELVIQMLEYEDSIIKGDIGKSIYEDSSFEHFSSLEPMYVIHRIVLNNFNFQTDDDDIDNYRKIFAYYYKSPVDYDKDVINSVAYMRENKCVFYTNKDFNIHDTFENIEMYNLNKNKINLFDKINKEDNYTLIGAFSNS